MNECLFKAFFCIISFTGLANGAKMKSGKLKKCKESPKSSGISSCYYSSEYSSGSSVEVESSSSSDRNSPTDEMTSLRGNGFKNHKDSVDMYNDSGVSDCPYCHRNMSPSKEYFYLGE